MEDTILSRAVSNNALADVDRSQAHRVRAIDRLEMALDDLLSDEMPRLGDTKPAKGGFEEFDFRHLVTLLEELTLSVENGDLGRSIESIRHSLWQVAWRRDVVCRKALHD